MADDKPKPVGDVFAIIGDGDDARWIKLAPVWENRDGSQSFTLDTEPVAWRDPNCVRRIQIREREDDRGSRDRGSNRSRANRR